MNRLTTILLLFFTAALRGQQAASEPVAPAVPAANPFELVHRLPKIVGGMAVARGPINPFDVVPHRAPLAAKASLNAPKSRGRDLIKSLTVPRGKSQSRTFLFWSLAAMLGFLAFSIAANRPIVEKTWRAFINENYLSLAQREATGLNGNAPYFLLYGNFLLNAGIFGFLLARFFKGDDFNNIGFLLLCVGGAAVVFLSKHLLLRFVGALYPLANEMRRYNFLITVFNCVLGLFLVPFNFLIAFVRDFEPFLVFWALGLSLVFYGYRTMRASAIGRKFLATDQFHFLVYLCAVEIAPVLLLIKLATLSAN